MAGAYGNIVKATTSSDNGSGVVTLLTSAMSTAGWSGSGLGPWTTVSGGTTLSVTFNQSNLSSGGVLPMTINGQSAWVASGNSTFASSFVGVEYSIGPSHFYVKLVGPAKTVSGTTSATYGSHSSFVLLTKYIPYFTSNATTSQHWALIQCFNGLPTTFSDTQFPTSSPIATILIGNIDGVTNSNPELCELATVRPVVQDEPSIGDLIPNKSYGDGIVYWPFIIINSTRGIVGRLSNVFFGGDNYLINAPTGDASSQLHSSLNVLIGTERYVRSIPAYHPRSDGSKWFTPFGEPAVVTNTGDNGCSGIADAAGPSASVALGGPNIIIKKGDGS